MTGVVGFAGRDISFNTGTLVRMNEAISHRAPEHEMYVTDLDRLLSEGTTDDSHFTGKTALLRHVSALRGMGIRCSDAQKPPFIFRNNICLAFDGEIYNFPQLRAQVTTDSMQHDDMSDAELLLLCYQKWGADFVQHLNGSFAIALFDLNLQKLLLIRDHLGIKPIYYGLGDRCIVFASEIKAILKHPAIKHKVYEEGLIATYLLEAAPEPYTCFENIFSVPAAHRLEVDLHDLSVYTREYWTLPRGQTTRKYKPEDAAVELCERLYQCVKMRLGADDASLISLMSGGIDSTTITAIAHQIRPSISCYSFAIDGSGDVYDELPQAVKMARTLKIHQIVQKLHPDDLASGLADGIRHFEAPYASFESNLLPAASLSKVGYKTMLSGNGADEVFGGPAYYLKIRLWKKLRMLGFLAPFVPAAGTFLTKVKNVLQINSVEKYYANTRLAMRPYQIRALMPGVPGTVVEHIIEQLYPKKDTDANDVYNTMFRLEIKHSFAAHHSFRDGLSAARYGMEFCYPFLDHSLVEWVNALPPDMRYSNTATKPLLRKAAERYILKENLTMTKKGFGVPALGFWQTLPGFRDFMKTTLSKLKQRNIYHNDVIDRWTGNIKTEFDLAKIWQLVTTEIWMETYLDGQPSTDRHER